MSILASELVKALDDSALKNTCESIKQQIDNNITEAHNNGKNTIIVSMPKDIGIMEANSKNTKLIVCTKVVKQIISRGFSVKVAMDRVEFEFYLKIQWNNTFNTVDVDNALQFIKNNTWDNHKEDIKNDYFRVAVD